MKQNLLLVLVALVAISSCQIEDRMQYDWYVEKCNIPLFWNEKKKSDVIVAVLDSGFDMRYKEYLGDRLLTGYDFIDNDADVSTTFNRHGTDVSLLIGANKSDEICGVDSRLYVLPVRVLKDDGTADEETIIKGIEYACKNNANVINMSFGTTNESTLLKEVIDSHINDAIFVSSVGDFGLNEFLSPAKFVNVIAVQAMDDENNLYRYSNLSYKKSIKAPGVNLKSPVVINNTVNKTRLDGSSYACAIASGIISSYILTTNINISDIDWSLFFSNEIINVCSLY